jgi:hypothetical protein
MSIKTIHDLPGAGLPASIFASVTSVPVVEAPAPVVEAPAPVVEAPAPVVEAPAPVVEAPAPVVEEETKAAAKPAKK